MIRFRSITARLTLFFSTASTLVLLSVGLLVGKLVDAHFAEQDLKELSGKLELVQHALKKVRSPAGYATLPQTLTDALIGHPDLSVAVRGPDNRLLFTSPHTTFATDLLQHPAAASPLKRPETVEWLQGKKHFRGIVSSFRSGVPGDRPLTIALAINTEDHSAFMKTFQYNLWLAIISGVLLTIFLGWFAAHRGMVPIRKMAEVTKRISASHLAERLHLDSIPEELGDLAVAINDMLARLEDSFRRLSDFSSDLAHELRTPISNLMTQTQVAVSKARSANEYREVLYCNLEEFERLARMISDMLFLAKADNGLITPSSETIELSKEILQLYGFYEAIAEDRGVRLVLTGTGQIVGDRLMLRRAFGNLLSNAIRHTPAYGSVTTIIQQEKSSGAVRMIFENTGETIPEEHWSRLFDRFYRVDSSRQKVSEGAGLGLAITKSIVVAHHGAIRVTSSNGQTRFEILFTPSQAESADSLIK